MMSKDERRRFEGTQEDNARLRQEVLDKNQSMDIMTTLNEVFKERIKLQDNLIEHVIAKPVTIKHQDGITEQTWHNNHRRF